MSVSVNVSMFKIMCMPIKLSIHTMQRMLIVKP